VPVELWKGSSCDTGTVERVELCPWNCGKGRVVTRELWKRSSCDPGTVGKDEL